MVGELEKWVEREWGRVRPVEKGVVEVDHGDGTDDCGCGSTTPEAEEPPEKNRRKRCQESRRGEYDGPNCGRFVASSTK
jgi:hypothetical protein